MATINIYASSVSGTGWTSPSNASGESDSSYATVTLARNTTCTLTATFTNSLPDSAIINSITVYCRLYRSNTTNLNTSSLGDTTVTIPTSLGNVSYSAGTSFPSSVALSIRTNQRNNLPTIYVDSFWLEVDYTEPVQERLFPYEIDSISASEMVETSTTETSATIVTTNEGTLGTDGARIDYRIPLAIGKTATLELDYTTDITSIYFYFRDDSANSIVDFINKRDTTSGHISVKLSNPSPTSDYIILRYKTYKEGTTTLSNITVTIENENINNFRLGDIAPAAFYLGDTPVKMIYLGETLLYE